MKITFISNYLNHHQLPLCKELSKLTNDNFRFVACEEINPDRISLGYSDMNQHPFVIRVYESEEKLREAVKWCMKSDVIIHGGAEEKFAKIRIEAGRPVFRYSERLFKTGMIRALSPRAIKNICKNHTKYRKNTVYMLCASAFTAKDFAIYGAYKNKAYRWGYFPEVKKYNDITSVIKSKKENTLLWVGRFIDWKHPEYAVEVANKLKQDGYYFTLNLIGNGEMENKLKKLIVKYGLEDYVHLLGTMSPEDVREHMETSEIFLFTSDHNEGWGAVLNESMNSGCAVVASSAIGAVPFLINDGENGLIYKNKNIKDLYNKVEFLLDHPQKRKNFGKNAYNTLITQWNATNAAKRFITLAEAVVKGEEKPDYFEDGVCSKAEILKDNWYKDKYLKKRG